MLKRSTVSSHKLNPQRRWAKAYAEAAEALRASQPRIPCWNGGPQMAADKRRCALERIA